MNMFVCLFVSPRSKIVSRKRAEGLLFLIILVEYLPLLNVSMHNFDEIKSQIRKKRENLP